MSHRVIEDDPSFPVKPDDIDCDQSFHWAFPDLIDGPLAHNVAKSVVRHCQRQGGWTSFTLGDVSCVSWNGLCEQGYVWKRGETVPITCGWIVLGEDGRYRVTSDFIFRCYGRASARRR